MDSLPPSVSANNSLRLRVALVSVGLASTVAQVVLLRELFVAAHGNELSIGLTLAVWLGCTAFGSACLARLFSRTPRRVLLAWLQIASGLGVLLSVGLASSSRVWWKAAPGESLGPVPMLVTALVSLAAFCPLSGWLFAVGSQAFAEETRTTTARGTGSTYLLEAIGASLGGLLTSVVLIRYMLSLQVAALVLTLNVIVAIGLLVQHRRLRLSAIVLAIAFCAYLTNAAKAWELRIARETWPGFGVAALSKSRYGSLAVLDTEGNRTVAQNGVLLFTVPDPLSAEEIAHFPLLEHPEPRSVLLIGGGPNGSIDEILKHSSVQSLQYVELDPEVLRLSSKYLPEQWGRVTRDHRVQIHTTDGRLFIKNSRQLFDVIIVNLPEPYTAQLNRFYTEEFFHEVSRSLATDGILALHLRGAEEYVSPELAELLGCIRATLTRDFPDVVTIPGETVHMFAAKKRGVLTADPGVLLARLHERRLKTQYFREYYIPFRMATERVADVHRRLAEHEQKINRDFAPVAYYFDMVLWSGQFSTGYRRAAAAFAASMTAPRAALGLAAVGVGLLFSQRRRPPKVRARTAATAAVAAAGVTAIGTELMILLGFQALYGYVFDEVALIVSSYMAGMASGSLIALRNRAAHSESGSMNTRRLAVAQALVAVSPVAVMVALWGLQLPMAVLAHPAVIQAVFFVLAAVCGVATGYQFPGALQLASASAADSPGRLYAVDLLGAAVGALFIGGYVFPLLGFARGALLMLIVNSIVLLLLAQATRPAIASRDSVRDQRTPAL